MAATAGQIAEAGRVPNERIATTVATSDSSTFTGTEVELMSVTAALVSGRTYRLTFDGQFGSDTSGDNVAARLRRDDPSTGATLRRTNNEIHIVSALGVPLVMSAEYTATSTGDVDFYLTGNRTGGTGNCRLEAAADNSSYLYVDYIRG